MNEKIYSLLKKLEQEENEKNKNNYVITFWQDNYNHMQERVYPKSMKERANKKYKELLKMLEEGKINDVIIKYPE